MLERGVVVNLENDVDGFVPLSQLGIDDLENPKQSFNLEDELPLKVVEFAEDQKKVVLSVIEYLRDKDQKEVDDYVAAHPIREVVEEPEGEGEAEEADRDEEMESWG
jgi:small subunit ribosomal protein S1